MTTGEEKKQNRVANAVIMAAGLSSRFAPLSYEYPKALVEVKGEVLIERQIKQLQAVGIDDITIVVGYKKEAFEYLIEKFHVVLVENPEYKTRNNHSSLYYVRDRLTNTYICSADNYFSENVFESFVEHAYYSVVFEEGKTDEWTIQTNKSGLITQVQIGGEDSYVMLGHVFFSDEFSKKFVAILESIYHLPETKNSLWERIYADHIQDLSMFAKKYSQKVIFEFDSLDELRTFDETYWNDTRSEILKNISRTLNRAEKEIVAIEPLKENNETIGITFFVGEMSYQYIYKTKVLIEK